MDRSDDRFRHVFGFPYGVPRGGGGGFFEDDDGDDEDPFGGFSDTNDIFSRFRFGNFGRSSPFNDMNDIFKGAETMLRHMDSMFRDMDHFGQYGGTFGHITGPQNPAIQGGGDDPYRARRRTPRDEMLKIPDSEYRTGQREDTDLDSQFESGEMDVDDLVGSRNRNSEVQLYEMPKQRSFWSGSQSVTTFSGFGDGRIEQKTSRRNADGSQSTVVTRRIGDRELITTTTIDSHGEKEVEEELINMDEEDKEQFDRDWNTNSSGDNSYRKETGRLRPSSDRDQLGYPAAPLDPKGPSIFSRLFGSWFK